MDGYYFMSNLTSIISTPDTAEYLLGLELTAGGASLLGLRGLNISLVYRRNLVITLT